MIMEKNISFYSLLIIAALAFLLPLIVSRFKRVKIPVVIAEIIAGIIVGKSGFNIIQNDLWIEFLSLFGFAYLMFLSGVEIDFSYLKKIRGVKSGKGNPLVIGIVIFALTIGLSFLISWLLTLYGVAKDPLFLTLIFSTTSLGIVVPILKENKIITEPIGQTILISALIADFASMLMIPVVMFFLQPEGGAQLLTSLIIFAAFVVVYLIARRFLKIDCIGNDTYESSQLRIRAAFALILVFVSLAELTGVEIILGAFLAGILFSLLFSEFRTEIVPKLDAIGYGFLIPIFFIMVGANFDLKTVLTLNTILSLPLYIAVAYVVKLVPSLILKIYYPWRESIGAGFLLASRLSLIIAIALVALESGIISETSYSTFVLVAIVTCIVSPVMFSKIFPRPVKKTEAVMIAGGNEIVASIACKIRPVDEVIILADASPKIRELFDQSAVKYTYWEAPDFDRLTQLKNTVLNIFVAAYDDDYINHQLSLMAKKAGAHHVIAVIEDTKTSYELEKHGVIAVTPVKAMHTLLYSLIMHPESSSVLFQSADNDNIDVVEITLTDQTIIGARLKNLRLPGDCLVLMISRDGKRLVPDGNTSLERDDILVIIGSKEYLDQLDEVVSH